MESTDISKYRIKLKYNIDNQCNKIGKYYPQYKSKLYGWRYIYSDWNKAKESTLLPFEEPYTVLIGFFSIISWSSSIYLLTVGDIILSLLLFILPLFVLWTLILLINKFWDKKIKFLSKEETKKWIIDRINSIIKEQDKHKQSKKARESLPDSEVYYLDIKSERKAKLQKLLRKAKL